MKALIKFLCVSLGSISLVISIFCLFISRDEWERELMIYPGRNNKIEINSALVTDLYTSKVYGNGRKAISWENDRDKSLNGSTSYNGNLFHDHYKVGDSIYLIKSREGSWQPIESVLSIRGSADGFTAAYALSIISLLLFFINSKINSETLMVR